MSETVCPGLERRLQGGADRRGHVRPLQPRPLRHRRLALSDHAGGRGRAAHDRGSQSGDRDRAGRGRADHAARRRHLAVRADHQHVADRRLLEISRQGDRARRRRPPLRGRARHRARRAQPPAQAARLVVSGRHLDRLARHHRRHGRQQFLRRALAALRQHPRERASRSMRCCRTAARCISARSRPISPTFRTALKPLARDLMEIGAREAEMVKARFPQVQRRVGGYNLDALAPGKNDVNLAHILVGSEGTLGFSTRIELKLSPLLGRRAVGACHFGSFQSAMEAAQHIVKLAPIAVELIDRTMLGLARDIAMFQPTINAVVRGDPEAILFVEFGEDDHKREFPPAVAALRADGRPRLRLGQHRRALGRRDRGDGRGAADGDQRGPRRRPQRHDVDEGRGQAGLVRRGLRGAARASRRVHREAHGGVRAARHPRHLVRACVGRLPACAADPQPAAGEGRQGDARHRRRGVRDGARLQGLAFRRARRRHRALGIPHGHVRRAAGERVRGREGPLRSERRCSIPARSCARRSSTTAACSATAPTITPTRSTTHLDWSAYPGKGGGFQGAVEMCNNNGACRALAGGVMCPSYRVTREERDVTRGRANTLRLAITGQLGPDALASDEMAETLKYCVSCKACRRECPTGVDMARMKIEVQAARLEKHGLSLHDRLVGYLPRYAPWAARFPGLANLRDKMPVAGADVGEARRLQRAAQAPGVARGRGSTGDSRRPQGATAPRSCCSPTPSTAISSRRISAPRLRCSKPPAAASICRSRWTARRGRCVAGARSCRSVWSIRRVRKPSARVAALEPYRRARRAGGRARAELHPRFPRRDPGLAEDRGSALAGVARHAVRGIRDARARARSLPLAADRAQRALLHGHCHQKSFGVMGAGRDGAEARAGARGRDDRDRAAAAWPAPSATAPTPSTCRSRWPSCRCCRRCARRRPTRSSSPTAPPAVTRSATAPAARRCMSRACWR